MCSLADSLWRFSFKIMTQFNSDVVVGARIIVWANRGGIDARMRRPKNIAHWEKIKYARASTTCIANARGEQYEKISI